MDRVAPAGAERPVPAAKGPGVGSRPGRPVKGYLRLVRVLFTLVGLLAVGFVAGAAVMFFQLPLSDWLGKAFQGGRAWSQDRQLVPVEDTRRPLNPELQQPIDKPGKAFDGFTLYAVAYALGGKGANTAETATVNTNVYLMNMKGEVVHHWIPSAEAIDATGLGKKVTIMDAHLYPNGDLLCVFHDLQAYTVGLGIAKFDKDSKLIWRAPGRMHHDVNVGEDGTIYGIVREDLWDRPPGMETGKVPWQVDSLVMLTPSGKIKKRIPLLNALLDSPYAPLLSTLEIKVGDDAGPKGLTLDRLDKARLSGDVMHTNCVRPLSTALAPKFPQFKAGQVLFSLRHQSLIGVLDPTTEKVVWAANGPWKMQHDPQFLDNGRLLIFDNLGSPRSSRVLEYDPQTQSFPWVYPGSSDPGFFTQGRGMNQRLPNGNTLIISSYQCLMMEVTADHEMVWCRQVDGDFVGVARRYAPEQVKFLKADQLPRPKASN